MRHDLEFEQPNPLGRFLQGPVPRALAEFGDGLGVVLDHAVDALDDRLAHGLVAARRAGGDGQALQAHTHAAGEPADLVDERLVLRHDDVDTAALAGGEQVGVPLEQLLNDLRNVAHGPLVDAAVQLLPGERANSGIEQETSFVSLLSTSIVSNS